MCPTQFTSTFHQVFRTKHNILNVSTIHGCKGFLTTLSFPFLSNRLYIMYLRHIYIILKKFNSIWINFEPSPSREESFYKESSSSPAMYQ